jgi:putative transposase
MSQSPPYTVYTFARRTAHGAHLHKSLTHIVFSTKNRLPYLQPERRADVFAYIGGIIRELQGSSTEINGVEDHIHLLVRLPASVSIAKAVEIIKTNSSPLDS